MGKSRRTKGGRGHLERGSRSLVKKSKRLSYLLRHGASEHGVDIDGGGWAPIEQVCTWSELSRDELLDVVKNNNKKRFEIDVDRDKIRAKQGHSAAGVTPEQLEATWEVYPGTGSIWHGTNVKAAQSIAKEGVINAGTRTHVHLADSPTSPVGKREGSAVLLEVSVERLRASGREVYRSANGVVLTREVPTSCVIGLQAVSKGAHKLEAALRALFEQSEAEH